MSVDMSSSPAALMAFAAWIAFHMMVIMTYRATLVITGKKVNTFGPSRSDSQSSFIGRVGSSHANCLENFPLFLTVVMVNTVTSGPDISELAWHYVYARVAQSLAHWYSFSELTVMVRLTNFLVSWGLLVTIGYRTMYH
jgi:uncharacterized MAPEG superfamily protein